MSFLSVLVSQCVSVTLTELSPCDANVPLIVLALNYAIQEPWWLSRYTVWLRVGRSGF
jgi:hypothetical protein